jgi:hypothetical protein
MNWKRLLLIPLLLGFLLVAFSWYQSYPLALTSLDDFVFNHISVAYWFGVSLVVASLFGIAATSESHFVKWLACVGLVMTFFSLSFFYSMLPGSDSTLFRGHNEYLLETGNLEPSQSRGYFQWPGFFVLTYIAVSVSGLNLPDFEFLQYAIIGILIVSTLYVYASKKFSKGGFVASILFPIGMFYFLDYQSVPFSLAFVLLLVLWMLDPKSPDSGTTVAILVLFLGVCLTHVFVPLFFIGSLTIRAILERKRYFNNLLITTVVVFLLVQSALALYSFSKYILMAFSFGTEYSTVMQQSIVPIVAPFDLIAQQFSRGVSVSILLLCFVGFLCMVIKRRWNNFYKSIFFVGILYLGVGAFIYTLGSRALPIAFIPISLGASYLLETKLRRYVKLAAMILIVLAVFIPIHASFNDFPILFQTEEAHTTTKFLVKTFNWNYDITVLSDYITKWYLYPQVEGQFYSDVNPEVFLESMKEVYNCIVVNVAFEKALQKQGISVEEFSYKIQAEYNVVYDSGSSYIAVGA